MPGLEQVEVRLSADNSAKSSHQFAEKSEAGQFFNVRGKCTFVMDHEAEKARFAIGFPITLTIGFTVLTLSLPYMAPLLEHITHDGLDTVLRAMQQLGKP